MNAKQEILDVIQMMEWSQVAGHCERIRAILETHALEPVDDRPFDPTLCGFERATSSNFWKSGSIELRYGEREGLVTRGVYAWFFPWPATQSEGERLFKLLGVLK